MIPTNSDTMSSTLQYKDLVPVTMAQPDEQLGEGCPPEDIFHDQYEEDDDDDNDDNNEENQDQDKDHDDASTGGDSDCNALTTDNQQTKKQPVLTNKSRFRKREREKLRRKSVRESYDRLAAILYQVDDGFHSKLEERRQRRSNARTGEEKELPKLELIKTPDSNVTVLAEDWSYIFSRQELIDQASVLLELRLTGRDKPNRVSGHAQQRQEPIPPPALPDVLEQPWQDPVTAMTNSVATGVGARPQQSSLSNEVRSRGGVISFCL